VVLKEGTNVSAEDTSKIMKPGSLILLSLCISTDDVCDVLSMDLGTKKLIQSVLLLLLKVT
jgi:hypothetical protein